MRTLAALVFLAAAAVLSVAVALGWVDLLAIAPLPLTDYDDAHTALAGMQSLEGFSIKRISTKDGAVVWSATGTTIARSDEGFVAKAPRVSSYDRHGERTDLAAPRATFGSPLAHAPLHAELQGGVTVSGPTLALETERLSIDLPATQGDRLTSRARPNLETRSAVRALFARRLAQAPPVLTGVIAEGGLEGQGDLRRLVLRGPVHIRDTAGDLLLEASRDATIALAPAPWRTVFFMEGTATALAGLRLFGPELEDGLVIEKLEARGSVRFMARSRDGRRIEAGGERLRARSFAGTLEVEGKDAFLADRSNGVSIAAPWIFARDEGRPGVRVLARGGATLGARLRTKRQTASRGWEVSGEEAEALLAPISSRYSKKGSEDRRVATARLASSAAHPGRYRSQDGHFQGSFTRFDETEDEEGNLSVKIEGEPLECSSDESHFVARSLDFTRSPGEPDRLVLQGGVRVAAGSDLRALASEKGIAAVGTTSGAWKASGDRIAATLAPVSDPARQGKWWQSQLLSARVEGAPARVEGARADGAPVRLEGAVLDFDLVSGKVSADAAPGGSAVAVLGSSTVAAKELRGDLATGRMDASGGVSARFERRGGAYTLSSERASVTVLADPEARKKLPEARPLGVPEDLIALSASGDVRVAGPDGFSLDAGQIVTNERSFVTSRDGGIVTATVRDTKISARLLEVRDLGGNARTLDLTDDARIAWTHSGTRVTLEADRVHSLAFANDLLGTPELEAGPLTAWQVHSQPLVIRSTGPETAFEAKGRVLRLYPRSGNGTLVGPVAGSLVGKAGIPFTFEAPRIDARLVQRPRIEGSEAGDKLLAALRAFEAFESHGGVRARYQSQTYEAESIRSDGKTVFLDAPVRVTDPGTNMEITHEMRIDLQGR